MVNARLGVSMEACESRNTFSSHTFCLIGMYADSVTLRRPTRNVLKHSTRGRAMIQNQRGSDWNPAEENFEKVGANANKTDDPFCTVAETFQM